MSTIASPRERRVPPHTPTSSSRPSLEATRSLASSPNPNNITVGAGATAPPLPVSAAGAAPSKRNRAALREYYNLKKNAAAAGTPTVEVTDPTDDSGSGSRPGSSNHGAGAYSEEVPPSELDEPGFDAAAYVGRMAAGSSLAELLRVYARVLGEARALDAEKKALVYDNYNKLITATETIRKMRANMDPLNPMASTLDPAIAQIYAQASSIREAMRREVPPPPPENGVDAKGTAAAASVTARRERTRQLARKVLDTPGRLRSLVAEGKAEEAEAEWALPRRLLVLWGEKGLGGADVGECLREGDEVLRAARGESGDEEEDGGEEDGGEEDGGEEDGT